MDKKISELLKGLSVEELYEVKDEVYYLIALKSSNQGYKIELSYDAYKGSGKCWIAKVDRNTKKILGFVDAESNVKTSNYKGYKTFMLKDGCYLSCESCTKSSDARTYFEIRNGECIDLD